MESKFTQNEISFNLYTNSQRRQLNFKQNSDLSSFRNQNFDNDQHVSYENLNLDFEEIVGSHQKIKNQETLAQESEIRKQKINFFKDQKSRIFSKKSQSIRKPNQIGYQIEELQIEEQEREQGKEIQINPIGNNNVNISRDIKEQKKNPLLNDHNQKYKALEILQKERMKVKVQKFQELSEQYRFRCLQYEHLEIIGDKSYFSRVKSKCASIFNTLPQIYRTSIDYASVAINKSMLLDPEGFVSSLTGSLVAIMSYSNFLISSLRINFPDFCNQDGHECISSFPFSEISIFCFLVKIIISLNTACKYKGKLLNDRSIILKSYMRKEFFIDIVPLIQIAIFTYTGFYYLGFIHILRLPYAFKLAEKLLEYFHIESRFFTFYQLTRLILLIFTVAHVCSVGFLLIAHFPQNNDNDNWIRNQNLQNSQWYDQYERSLYFVMITMITVGFGDITPVNSRERIYVILMTMISCGVFAYAVNTVGYIFQQKDNEQSNLKQKKFDIIQYMQSKRVDKSIQRKVLREIQYMGKMEKAGVYNQSSQLMLQQLSKDVQEELICSVSIKILRNCGILNTTFSIQFLQNFSSCMKEMTLRPGQILFRQNEMEQRLYFIEQGQVQLFLKTPSQENEIIFNTLGVKQIKFEKITNQSFKLSKQNQYIGESQFLCPKARKLSCRSVGVTNIIYFNHEDLVSVLMQYPEDFEKYCKKRDQIKFLKQQKDSGLCYGCQQFGHYITACPRLLFVPKKEILCYKYNVQKQKQLETRTQYVRASKRKFHSLAEIKKIRRGIIQVRSQIAIALQEQVSLSSICLEDYQIDYQMNDEEFLKKYPAFIYHQKSEYYETVDGNADDIEALDEQPESGINVKEPSVFHVDCSNATEFDDVTIFNKVYDSPVTSDIRRVNSGGIISLNFEEGKGEEQIQQKITDPELNVNNGHSIGNGTPKNLNNSNNLSVINSNTNINNIAIHRDSLGQGKESSNGKKKKKVTVLSNKDYVLSQKNIHNGDNSQINQANYNHLNNNNNNNKQNKKNSFNTSIDDATKLSKKIIEHEKLDSQQTRGTRYQDMETIQQYQLYYPDQNFSTILKEMGKNKNRVFNDCQSQLRIGKHNF